MIRNHEVPVIVSPRGVDENGKVICHPGDVLTCDGGSWESDSDNPTFDFRWLKDKEILLIGGAAYSYQVTPADVGHDIAIFIVAKEYDVSQYISSCWSNTVVPTAV